MRSDSMVAMNWPMRSLSWCTRKRVKPTLVSNSHMKVARFIMASSVSRRATRSYLRASFLRTVPSPIQPPAPPPANVMALPSSEMALIFMRPLITPVQ